jgi:hypothetical protein
MTTYWLWEDGGFGHGRQVGHGTSAATVETRPTASAIKSVSLLTMKGELLNCLELGFL